MLTKYIPQVDNNLANPFIYAIIPPYCYALI